MFTLRSLDPDRHPSPYDQHPKDSAPALEPLNGCKRSQACKPNDVGEQSGAEYLLYHRRRCRRNCRAVVGRPSLRRGEKDCVVAQPEFQV